MRLEVGRIGRAHGLHGEVAVVPITNRTERFAPGSTLYVDDRAYIVAEARPHQQRWLVRFEGVDDRTTAETLRGRVLTGDAPADLHADELWVHQVIGAVVRDPSGRRLGTVVAVEANPAHDLLVLDGGELVPVVFVVSHETGTIVVDVPDGLLDLVTTPVAFRVDVFTIFPEYLDAPLRVSLVGRARERGVLEVRLHDPRDTTIDRHRSVDDEPFGGGAGMVMTPGPLFDAVAAVAPPRPLLLLSASGRPFDQARGRDLAAGGGFSLICGRYEGVDQRVADHLCDGELSVGDFVLAGGEAAALVVVETVARLLPGVMGNASSASDESFNESLLEYPQYTRPAEFRRWEVPEVLRSGDHGRIARWRRAQALHRTRARRPELLGRLSADDEALMAEFPDEAPPR